MGFENYKGSIKLGAGLTPAADGYPLMQSCDIQVDEQGTTLAEWIARGGGAVATARIGEVTLLASAWAGEGNLYSQVVSIEGVTENSQVDLTPDIHQLAIFYEKDLAFVTENEDGVVTVYAIGQKPANDYTIQVTITEVNV